MLVGQYCRDKDGQPCCSDCYRDHVLPKCVVCGTALSGKYLQNPVTLELFCSAHVHSLPADDDSAKAQSTVQLKSQAPPPLPPHSRGALLLFLLGFPWKALSDTYHPRDTSLTRKKNVFADVCSDDTADVRAPRAHHARADVVTGCTGRRAECDAA